MGQVARQPSKEERDLGGVADMLFMEQCATCGAPVTILGAKPEVITCPRCAAESTLG